MADNRVGLLSVNVGLPSYLGEHRGRSVTSGIVKRPVTQETLWLDRLNLEGDGQADLEVHGGPDKAVYAYPSEHFPAWTEELQQDILPAAFGENLTVAGWLEDDVRIGDTWAWGDAVLQVSQPRWPCYKLTMHRRSGRVAPRLRNTGRTGWYLRVLQEGRVPVAGPIEVVERHPAGVTVREVHEARLHGMSQDELMRLIAVEALAGEWRAGLGDRFLHAE